MTAVGGNCYFSLPLAPSQPHVTFFSLVLCGIEEPYHLTVFRIKSLIQVQIKILWSVDCKHIGRSIIFRSLNNFRMGIFRPLFIFLGFKNTLACSIFLLSMWIESNLRSVWTSGSIKIVYAWYWVLVRYLFAIVRVVNFFFLCRLLELMYPWYLLLKMLFVLQENLQFHVAHVERHVFCEQLTQQITGEESSIHVHHKHATSLCM